MSNAKALWFGAGEGAPRPDFTLLNDSNELQAYNFDGSTFTTLGAATSIGFTTPDRAGICGLSATTVAVGARVGGNANNGIGKFRFARDQWVQVGNLSDFAAIGNFITLCGVGANRVGISSANTGLQTYDFDGSDWAAVGNTATAAGTESGQASGLDEVIITNGTGNRIQPWDFDGTDWNIGTASSTDSAYAAVACLSPVLVAVIDYVDDQLKTLGFSGGAWAQVGNALTITGIGSASICALSASRVVVGDNTAQTLQAYDFDGTDWATVGSSVSALIPEWNNLANNRFLLI